VEVFRHVAESASGKALSLKPKYKDEHYEVLSIRPEREKTGTAPQHTPSIVASCYEQGCRALAIGDADIAGMGFRKALDTATRQMVRVLNPPDLQAKLGLKLKPRIDWLHSRGKLTDELKTWAHKMRDEVNDAAHEEDPYSDREAKDLRELTEVFLLYVFTIPGKIKELHPELTTDVAGQEPADPAPVAATAHAS
jgi:hypothetical protein